MPSNCSTCGASYSVEPEEIIWIGENQGDMPTLCPRCRAFKAGIQDESITCTVCGKVFIYPRELRLYSNMLKWPRPRRCLGGCRRPGPEMTDEEKAMADFLKRLRSARKAGSGSYDAPPSFRRVSRPGASRISSSDGGSDRRPGKTPEEGTTGAGLAQALREFQERKRRGGR